MYFYQLQGLIIKSQIQIKKLKTIQTDHIDVTIYLSDFNPFENKAIKEGLNFRVTKDATYLIWKGIGSFKIRGKEILVQPEPSVNKDKLLSYIFGPVLAVFAHQKGGFILHGSAVEMGGHAVAFIGEVGSGKSTTAMILQNKGYPLISDDIISIELSSSGYPVVYRGMPVMKLCHDVSSFIKDYPNFGNYFHRTSRKNFLYTPKWTKKNSTILKSVYVLNKGDKLSLSPIKPSKVLLNLVCNSFLINIFDNKDKSENLFQCVNIQKKIDTKMLTRNNSLHDLEKMADMIEKDVLKK
jgi:hypothetical protein